MFKRILSILCIFIVVIGFVIYPLTQSDQRQHLSQFSGDNDGIDNDGDRYWKDKDGDGWGSDGSPYTLNEDTNDDDPSVHPDGPNSNRVWGVDEADEGDYDDISIFRNAIAENSNHTVKTLLSSPSTLRGMVDPTNTLYIVTGIEKQYKTSEISAIVDFVKNGGTAIMADDFGYANDIAEQFGMAFYKGVYLDREFIKNTNFTLVAAKISRDKDLDGVWDEDDDGDGRADEDPVNYYDDDEDWTLSTDDTVLDNRRPDIGEPHVDEDPLDDDNDNVGHIFNYDGIDNDNDGLIDEGDEGINEEEFNGIDDDGDGQIDEDTKFYKLVLNRPTGIHLEAKSKKARIIAQGSKKSYVDMNGDGVITLPDMDSENQEELADEREYIKVIVEVSVCPECGTPVLPSEKVCLNDDCKITLTKDVRKRMGRIIFIADGSIFTNNLVQIDELDAQGMVTDDLDNDGRPDGDGEWDYDNLAFGLALVQYLQPDGGVVVFDESRHAQDRFMAPISSSIELLAWITSDIYLITVLLVSIGIAILLLYLFVRGKENWIHRFNIHRPKHRTSLPNTAQLQAIRFRRAILEKVRMSRGLSPEEFGTLRPEEIASIIRDPVLADLALKDDKSYNSAELNALADRIRSWG